MKKLLALLLISALFVVGCARTDDTDTTDTDDIDTTDTDTTDTTDNTTDTMPLLVGKNALYVAEQRPGTTVEVSALVMESPGFVVIHENQNGTPGKIIGKSSLLDKDDNGAAITLDRQTTDGEKLIAMIHKDNGNSTFSETEDTSVKDDQGEDVMMEFEVSANAPEVDIISL